MKKTEKNRVWNFNDEIDLENAAPGVGRKILAYGDELMFPTAIPAASAILPITEGISTVFQGTAVLPVHADTVFLPL